MQWWCAALGETWTWTWRAYPGVWLFVVAVMVGLRAMTGAGSWARAPHAERAAFIAGIITLWLSLDWPLGPIAAGYLASAHALQFLIMTMFTAPFLLLGARTGLVERAAMVASGSAVHRIGRLIVHPLVAALVFNIIVAATHVPAVVDGLMPKPAGAFLIDSAWLLGGLVFWWPVVMPVPVYDRFGEPMKILYLLVGTLFHTVIGMIMLSAEFPLYGIYELAPPIIAVPAHADQQLAGGVMELGVFGAIVFASGILFFRWASRDGKAAH